MYSLDGVLLEDNYASNTGGAIYSSGCTVELEDCELADNEAGSNGGAAAVMDGGLGLTDSDVYDNVAPYFGGAVLVYGGSIGSASLSLDGTMVSDNDGSLGTIALLGDGRAVSLECVGSSTTSEGLTSNSDDLGALYLADEYGEASIDTCDFGTSSGGDDNDPADVYTMLGNSLSLDNDESIECADGVCALGTFTAGGTTFSYGGASQLRGVVVEATATGFITSLGFNVSGGCDVDLYLASSDSLSGPWSEDYSTTVSNASSGWNDVSTDLLVTSGRYYAAVYGWQACSMTYYDGVSGSDMGFGTYYGITGSSTYGGSLPNLTVSLSNNAYPVRFDVSL